MWPILYGLATMDENVLGAPCGRIGKFTLERWLGNGATSSVWSAKRDGKNDEEWFLKDFKEEIDQNVMDAEYENLRLPQLRQLAVDEVDYFVAERRVLCGKLVCTKITTMTSLHWAQLIRVLQALHMSGRVHRDARSPNFTLQDASGKLRLLDFGFVVPNDDCSRPFCGNIELAADELLAQCSRNSSAVIVKPVHYLGSAVKCFLVM